MGKALSKHAPEYKTYRWWMVPERFRAHSNNCIIRRCMKG